MAFYRCAGGTDPTGNAGVGDVLAGKTFSNADGIDKTGTMTNRGAITQSLNTSTTSYTIPAGYHNGSGKVSITTQEKTVTSSRSAQTVTPDSGKVLSKVTVNALAPTGTYTPTSRAANIDMGATSNYRYVTTTSVPNTNSGTYTYAANSTGGTVDMGATNTYRYVNAANVYAKGKADGFSGIKFYRYSIGNVAACTINNVKVGDYIFLIGYAWNGGSRPDYLVDATKSGLSSEIRFQNLTTSATPASGGRDDMNFNNAPFLIYKATATTVTISKTGTAYMVVRMTFD